MVTLFYRKWILTCHQANVLLLTIYLSCRNVPLVTEFTLPKYCWCVVFVFLRRTIFLVILHFFRRAYEGVWISEKIRMGGSLCISLKVLFTVLIRFKSSLPCSEIITQMHRKMAAMVRQSTSSIFMPLRPCRLTTHILLYTFTVSTRGPRSASPVLIPKGLRTLKNIHLGYQILYDVTNTWLKYQVIVLKRNNLNTAHIMSKSI